MRESMLFMHSDATDPSMADDGENWSKYRIALRESGQFDGGSSIGTGYQFKNGHALAPANSHVTGFARVRPERIPRTQSDSRLVIQFMKEVER